MKKIAVIQDLSGLGKCSLSAAIPVISVMGVQACPLPTAILSNQTGYSSYYCTDYSAHMLPYMEEWEKNGAVFDGIYTGFLASEQEADNILTFIQKFQTPETKILVDPVMGDGGEKFPFYTQSLCEKMRTLVRAAQVITPNLTEAVLLLWGKEGLEERKHLFQKKRISEIQPMIEEIGKALLEAYDLETVLITGIICENPEHSGELMCNLVATKDKTCWISSEKTGGSYSGTGDLFASVIAAGMVKGDDLFRTAQKATDFLSCAVRDTEKEGKDRNEGVCFEPWLAALCDK